MSEYDECAITDLSNQVNERDKENQQLKARIARLEKAAQMAILRNPYCDHLEEVLNESPQQSMAAIQANSVEDFKQYVLSGIDGDDGEDIIVPQSLFDDYANQLRQQGKEEF